MALLDDLFGTHLSRLYDLYDAVNVFGQNSYEVLMTGLLDDLSGKQWYESLENMMGTVTGVQDVITSQAETLVGLVDVLLTDPEKVIAPLKSEGYRLADQAGAEDVVRVLYGKMLDDNHRLKRTTLTISDVTRQAPADAGELLVDRPRDGSAGGSLLSGYDAPGYGWPQVTDYAYDYENELWPGEGAGYEGTACEMTASGEVAVECIRDSGMDGTGVGSEEFAVQGSNGSQRGLTPGGSLLMNGGFDSWESNTPDGWLIASGSAGTHVFEETSGYDGSCLKMVEADGTTISLEQTVTLDALRRYLLAFRVKAEAGVTGSLTVQVTGTGWTPSTSSKRYERVLIPQAELAGLADWTLYHCWLTAPRDVPPDAKVQVSLEPGGSPAGAAVWVDNLVLNPAFWYEGLAMGLVAGRERFHRGDRFHFTVTTGETGKLQELMVLSRKMQLPSSNVPTIPDPS